MNSIKKSLKASNGITLIALVVTVIVLLILAGISISMLSGNNGILQRATDAKTQTDIAQEKEIVTLAYNSALMKKIANSDNTAVTAGDLNDELTNQGATASESNPIKITFTNSKRQYNINNNGIIEYAGIQSEEQTVATTDIYATVCTDGEKETLLFSNNQKAIEDFIENNDDIDLSDGYTIKNIVDDVYYYNDDSDYNFTAWYGDTNITKVKILNKIIPKNTTIITIWWSYLANLTSIENLGNLDTRYVTDMSWMFSGLENLTSLDLSQLNTSNVTNMEGMFAYSGFTSLDLSKFDTSNVTKMRQLIDGCENLSNLNINNFNFSNVEDLDGIDNLGYNLYVLNNVCMKDIIKGNTLNIVFLHGTTGIGPYIENLEFNVLDVENIDCECLFSGLTTLKCLDLSNFNTSSITNMAEMFLDCENLQTIYVSNAWDVSNVNASTDMFAGCTKLPNYNSNVVDKTNAHYNTGGYLTYKATT